MGREKNDHKRKREERVEKTLSSTERRECFMEGEGKEWLTIVGAAG